MHAHTPQTTPASSRLVYIDRLRGWAVFVMIETHVVNALLCPDIKSQPLFQVLSFVNGLVAPSFLFCAGFAFAITLGKRWGEYVALRPALWKYISRMLFILVVAYSLHLPFFSFTRLRDLEDAAAWLPFFQVDILQVIAVTLLIMMLLAVALRSRRTLLIALYSLSAVVVFAAPIIRDLDYSTSPVWLRTYFTTAYRSQFPLFPWSAFLICGALIGWYMLDSRAAGREAAARKRLMVLSLGALVLSLAAEVLPWNLYPGHAFFKASPEFFFVRLALVVIALAALAWNEERGGVRKSTPILLFGQESLLVYVVHLLVVYGYTYKLSFIRLFGPTLDYAECMGLFLLLTAAMAAMAWVWHWLKRTSVPGTVAVKYAVLGGIVVTFLLKTS